MAWGSGSFTEAMNNKLPGTYINVVVTGTPDAVISDRGHLAVALPLEWGTDEDVFEVTIDDFKRNCKEIFGYAYGSEEILPIEEMFRNATTLYIYRTNSGNKATSEVATARCSGELGNNIKIVIEENPNYIGDDDEEVD